MTTDELIKKGYYLRVAYERQNAVTHEWFRESFFTSPNMWAIHEDTLGIQEKAGRIRDIAVTDIRKTQK